MRTLKFRKTINIGALAWRTGRGPLRVLNRSLPKSAVSCVKCACSKMPQITFRRFSTRNCSEKGQIQMLLLPRRRRPLARSLSLSHTFDVMALGGKDGIGGRIGPATATAAATPAKGGAKISLDSDGLVPYGYSASTREAGHP